MPLTSRTDSLSSESCSNQGLLKGGECQARNQGQADKREREQKNQKPGGVGVLLIFKLQTLFFLQIWGPLMQDGDLPSMHTFSWLVSPKSGGPYSLGSNYPQVIPLNPDLTSSLFTPCIPG